MALCLALFVGWHCLFSEVWAQNDPSVSVPFTEGEALEIVPPSLEDAGTEKGIGFGSRNIIIRGRLGTGTSVSEVPLSDDVEFNGTDETQTFESRPMKKPGPKGPGSNSALP